MFFDVKLEPAQIKALAAWTSDDGATVRLRVHGTILVAGQGDDRAAWAFDGGDITDGDLDTAFDSPPASPDPSP